MRSWTRVGLPLVLTLAIAPLAARADHTCRTTVVIFGHTTVGGRSAGGVNPNGVRCLLTRDDARDLHVLEPGANAITVRYDADLGAAVTELPAVLDGAGFAGTAVTLVRERTSLGAWRYDSPLVALAGAGCISATVTLPDGSVATDRYATFGSSCASGAG